MQKPFKNEWFCENYFFYQTHHLIFTIRNSFPDLLKGRVIFFRIIGACNFVLRSYRNFFIRLFYNVRVANFFIFCYNSFAFRKIYNFIPFWNFNFYSFSFCNWRNKINHVFSFFCLVEIIRI